MQPPLFVPPPPFFPCMHACKPDWQVRSVSFTSSLSLVVRSGLVSQSNQTNRAQRSAVQVQQLTRACACTAASVSRPFLSFPRHQQGQGRTICELLAVQCCAGGLGTSSTVCVQVQQPSCSSMCYCWAAFGRAETSPCPRTGRE